MDPAQQRPEAAEAAPEEVAAARDATNWAKSVTHLQVGEISPEAVNRNVEGRRLTGPIQGFGRMWQKTYQVRVPAERVSPTELIATWKARFPDFWPEGQRFYGPLTGIAPGEVAVLNMSVPGGVKLSTGVMVLYADEESFTFMTPQGHMFAGWITFSAAPDGAHTVAQTQLLIRANDPIYELGMTLGGHGQEDRFWQSTLGALARHFGEDAPVDTRVVCVDRRRQWSKAGNIVHNAAIRSTGQMLTAPFRRRRPAP